MAKKKAIKFTKTELDMLLRHIGEYSNVTGARGKTVVGLYTKVWNAYVEMENQEERRTVVA